MEAEVPLSIFTAFVSASSGAAQLSIGQEAKEKYDPRTDFYKPLREATARSIFTHDAKHVRRAAARASSKRQEQYGLCATGIEKWLDKTEFSVVERLSPIKYPCGDLTINVTTDFALNIDGALVLLKPFLRQDLLTRDARNAFSYLVTETHGALHPGEPKLLVAREATLAKGYPTKGAATILKAEADKFLSMWRSNRVA